MACQIGIKLLVKKETKDKPWFKYEEDKNFILVLESPLKRIYSYNIFAVAKDVANSLNKGLNKEYEVGNVFFATKNNGITGVEIKPTNKQLEVLNSKDAEEAEKIRQEAIAEHPELFFKEQTIAEIDIENSEILRQEQENKDLTQYQNLTKESDENFIASEKTIRDLAARLSDRIGIPFIFESDRTKEYKGKLELQPKSYGTKNVNYSSSEQVAVINLAYATLDTPIHEILGHPIIRAIKNQTISEYTVGPYEGGESLATFKTRSEAEIFVDNHPNGDMLGISTPNIKQTQLYQNLLKELEIGKGKEVLDRIKRDYNLKQLDLSKIPLNTNSTEEEYNSINAQEILKTESGKYKLFEKIGDGFLYSKTISQSGRIDYRKIVAEKYTLEEQQEEAIVELLGLMTAEKLDNVKDGKLISLLKRLLKEMKQFIRSLINQKEVEIDKLPDNMTLGDLANLLAYSNSKLILPGYEVEYTTPDNNKFKTYQEANNHISELAKNVKDVDLDNIKLKKDYTDSFEIQNDFFNEDGTKTVIQTRIWKENNKWFKRNKATLSTKDGDWKWDERYNEKEATEFNPTESELIDLYNKSENAQGQLFSFGAKDNILNFIEKNKEYEQSKEIIEEWKKVNNIKYNPEEIYSRGQEFSSVVGAYSDFDVNLMMQNLLQHIEDNEKAGGKFAISSYTKPIDKQIRHLEGGGGKIKFKIYPKSNDILWASNTDVYSGSVWDASEKVNKDKKSELLGVSYTKYPSLQNVNAVQPNLASIIDNLSHHHNELAISLNFSNFELEVDEDVPYQTKKIIENVNKILQQKRLEEINSLINKLEKEC